MAHSSIELDNAVTHVISLECIVGFYTLDKTAVSPSFGGVVSVGDEPYHSTLPKLLVVSQTFVMLWNFKD